MRRYSLSEREKIPELLMRLNRFELDLHIVSYVNKHNCFRQHHCMPIKAFSKRLNRDIKKKKKEFFHYDGFTYFLILNPNRVCSLQTIVDSKFSYKWYTHFYTHSHTKYIQYIKRPDWLSITMLTLASIDIILICQLRSNANSKILKLHENNVVYVTNKWILEQTGCKNALSNLGCAFIHSKSANVQHYNSSVINSSVTKQYVYFYSLMF